MKHAAGQSKTGVLVGVAAAGVGVLGILIYVTATLMVGGRKADDASRGSGLGEEFTYDLAAYRRTDPALIGYGEVARVATGFKAARGIAVGPAGVLYVAGDRAVRMFDPSGAPAGEFAVDGEPRCLAVTEDGTVYVGLKDHVEVFGPDGRRQAAWPSLGARAYLTSVAVGEGGVFAADAGGGVVVRYDTAGKVGGELGRKDPARDIPGVLIPSPHFDVACARDGLVRVTNPGRHLVEAYTVDGDRELAWGRASAAIEGFSGCCNPTDLAVLADGSVVTSEKGLARVKVYDAQGSLLCVVAGAETFPVDAAGLDLATDADGRIYVLDPTSESVRVFAKKPRTAEATTHDTGR